VKEAAEYYRQKIGKSPNLCFVNPKTLDGMTSDAQPVRIENIELRPARTVMNNHYWMGVNDQGAAQ
jgi:hypothetical protein